MKLKIFSAIVILFLFTGYRCHRQQSTTSTMTSCATIGSYGVFVAKFDADAVGSRPSTTQLFGPAGAALNMEGTANSIEVINSVPLGSQSLRISRDSPVSFQNLTGTVIEFVAGDPPHNAGIVDLQYKIYAEESPDVMLASMNTAVRSADETGLMFLQFRGGSYKLSHRDGVDDLPGTFIVNTVHKINIKLNLTTRKFSVCINDQLLASNKPLFGDESDDLHLLQFSLNPFVTEAHPASYVVDEIRIIK